MEREWEKELESARALTAAAIRVGESTLDKLAETRPCVKFAADQGFEGADALLERIDLAIGPNRVAA